MWTIHCSGKKLASPNCGVPIGGCLDQESATTAYCHVCVTRFEWKTISASQFSIIHHSLQRRASKCAQIDTHHLSAWCRGCKRSRHQDNHNKHRHTDTGAGALTFCGRSGCIPGRRGRWAQTGNRVASPRRTPRPLGRAARRTRGRNGSSCIAG